MLRIREVAQPDTAPAEGMPRPSAAASAAAASAEIIRDFDDPYLELVRLLREAAEIEHALMVQYLYGAYSLKPAYAAVRGFSTPSPNHLLGVAIQEMQHLEKVNRMLGELGSAPNLVRQGFPYEPDIYPFPLNLEPLSRITLAKYVYTEAPAHKLDRDNPDNADPATQAFLDQLDAALGGVRPNHVGSLYKAIIDRTNEVIAAALPGLPDLSAWPGRMLVIKGEGESEQGHFGFFRSVFLGTHGGFGGHPDPWALPPDHPDYPAVDLGTNPSALDGNPNTIPTNAGRRRLAWLSDLHYWIILALLDLGYRTGLPAASARAKRHMTSALGPLGAHLATLGAGLPFDPLTAGYALGRDTPTTARLLRALVHEAQEVTDEIHDLLPNGFPTTLNTDTLAALNQIAPESGGGPGNGGGGGGGEGPAADQVASDFWFTYDDHFLFNPPPQVLAAYAALGDIDAPLTQFTQTRATGTFPADFRTAVEPLRAGLTTLSTEQLSIIDQFYPNDNAALQTAFEHFGCGDLFDDRRPPGNKVHMMDSSGPANPPIGYHRWHAIIRAMTELGIDADRWNAIDRFVALAWAIHAETQPTQDADNPPVGDERLAALRTNWLNRTPDELDDAFDAFPFPAATP
jgi:hypothetical protein